MHLRPARRALLLALAGALGGCQGHRLSGLGSGPGPVGLTAGITDDNVRLPEYLDYVAAYPHGDVPKLDLADRQIVTVAGPDGLPLWDVGVTVGTGEPGGFRARTDSAGRLLIPRAALAAPDVLLVEVDGAPGRYGLSPSMDRLVVRGAWRRPVRPGVAVDVALVVDTTASMADEVARLRETLLSAVSRLERHPLRPYVRIGGVAYRDVREEYVTRRFEFTAYPTEIRRTLEGTTAAGGGDEAEAVQEALDVAVNRLAWGGEGTVRVLFLVGDAPPHFERGRPYTETARDAIARGITIVPVACSDMDDRGEFVWRQLAALTLGEFLFVSYGGTTEHHTGPYLENDLDTLLLRVVGRRLDELATTPAACAPPPPAVPVDAAPSWGAPDGVGFGRAPWDFGIPGWPRR